MRIVVLVLVLLGSLGDIARAEDKPWAVGVPADKQKQALGLYNRANERFADDKYVEAYDLYEQALAAWDHPAIHYNAAVCLIHLDRPLEAYDHLTQAMKYGAAPLGADLWKEAQGYDKLLARQLGAVEVTCDEPGAEITLDGKPLFTAPGTQTRRVLTGPHQVVATKPPTHQTETQSITVEAGQTKRVTIVMRKREAARRVVRRWDAWKPWAVVIGGGVLASAGVGFYAWSASDFDAFDAHVQANFDNRPMGQPPMAPSDEMLETRDRAELTRAVSYGSLAVGIAALATGGILVVMNQPRVAPAVTPTLGREQVGLAISGRF